MFPSPTFTGKDPTTNEVMLDPAYFSSPQEVATSQSLPPEQRKGFDLQMYEYEEDMQQQWRQHQGH